MQKTNMNPMIKLKKLLKRKTDKNGDTTFSGLKPAIYLAVESTVPTVTGKQLFESKPFLVSIPYTAGRMKTKI